MCNINKQPQPHFPKTRRQIWSQILSEGHCLTVSWLVKWCLYLRGHGLRTHYVVELPLLSRNLHRQRERKTNWLCGGYKEKNQTELKLMRTGSEKKLRKNHGWIFFWRHNKRSTFCSHLDKQADESVVCLSSLDEGTGLKYLSVSSAWTDGGQTGTFPARRRFFSILAHRFTFTPPEKVANPKCSERCQRQWIYR